MGFNLAKMRQEANGAARKRWEDKGPPKEDKYSQEYEYHKNLMQVPGFDPAIEQLSQEYAYQAMAKSPKEPTTVALSKMMGEYFHFLGDYSDSTRQFRKSLVHTYEAVVKALKDDPEAFQKAQESIQPEVPGMQPAMAPAPAAPAPAMGPMASSNKEVKTSAHSLYLVKKNGKYLLRDSLVGKILRGAQQYVGPDGVNRVLAIDGDVLVPRTSAPAKIAFWIQDELPNALLDSVTDELEKSGMKDKDLPRSIVGPYLNNGSLDLRPLSVRIAGAPLGFLLYSGVEGTKEPESVHRLRLAVGKLMDTFVSKLKTALEMKGIKVGDRKLKMPSYFRSSEDEQEVGDRYPTRDPNILKPGKSKDSMDLRSLAMTAASQQSDDKQKNAALDRLLDIISSHPKLYGTRPLSNDDINVMRSMASCRNRACDPICLKMEGLQSLVELFDADDSKILEAYSHANGTFRSQLAKMIINQKRKDAVMANPDIAMDASCASCINPLDGQGLEIVKKLVGKHARGEAYLNNPSIKKGMQALYENGDEELLESSLHTDTLLRDLAVSILLENGGQPGADRALGEIQKGMRTRPGAGPVLLTISILKGTGFDPAAASLAKKTFSVAPEKLASFMGRDFARSYMRKARVGWEGDSLPAAADITSLTDDPLPLIKNYYELAKDGEVDPKAALHRLYHLISERMSGEDCDPYMGYSHNFLRDALVDLGEDAEMLGALVPASREPDRQPSLSRMLPDGSVMVKRAGVYSVKGAGLCFSSAPHDAFRIAAAKLAEARE